MVEPSPSLSPSLRLLIQRPLTPQNFCGRARAPEAKLPHAAHAEGQPPRTRWKPCAASLAAHIWSPDGRAPPRNLCAWGQPSGRPRGSSLRPLPPAPPGRRGAGSGRAGRAPGGARHRLAGEGPRAPTWGLAARPLGEAGSPLRTRVCKALASPALRPARGPGRRTPCAREASGEGLARGSGPQPRRVQTGPRQPNPADRARGRSQG